MQNEDIYQKIMTDKKKVKLKVGDIVNFELNYKGFVFKKQYGFARVIAKTKLGDAIEVYDYFSDNPDDYENAIKACPIFEQPVILDGYSIFWKRLDNNWSLIKHDTSYQFEELEKVKIRFKYGAKGFFKLIDLNDVSYSDISQEEAEKYPDYSPYSSYAILRRIDFLMKKRIKE